jgi:hypothetical protein
VVDLKKSMVIRNDSLQELENIPLNLTENYETKITANQYRSVTEYELYLSERYPKPTR